MQTDRNDETAGWRPWWVPLVRPAVAGDEMKRGDVVVIDDGGPMPATAWKALDVPPEGILR